MSLRLPDALPYDFVDEMLDEQFRFGWEEWTCNWETDEIYVKDTTYRMPYARRVATEEGPESISNYGRQLFELLSDGCGRYDEDEEGYINWPYHDGMCWTAKPLTESQIDKILEEAGV